MKSNNFLRRYTKLPYLIDFLSTGQLFLPNPRIWDDRNDSFYIEEYLKINEINDAYALCLTTVPETYHHWKVFSSGSSGVCIVFDKDKLLQVVNATEELKADSVKYKTIKEVERHGLQENWLPFLKRYPYRDESEFRLFVAPKKEITGGEYRVEVPKTALKRIILSPWLPTSVVSHVETLLKSIKDCSNIKVHRSTLIDNEKWRAISPNFT